MVVTHYYTLAGSIVQRPGVVLCLREQRRFPFRLEPLYRQRMTAVLHAHSHSDGEGFGTWECSVSKAG